MSSVWIAASAPPKSHPAPQVGFGGKSPTGHAYHGHFTTTLHHDHHANNAYKTAFPHKGFGGTSNAMKKADDERFR